MDQYLIVLFHDYFIYSEIFMHYNRYSFHQRIDNEYHNTHHDINKNTRITIHHLTNYILTTTIISESGGTKMKDFRSTKSDIPCSIFSSKYKSNALNRPLYN